MKKLIELLDKYEEIKGEMSAIGCIDTLISGNRFELDALIKIIKDYDLEFTIIKFSEKQRPIIKVVVGKHALFAIANEPEFRYYFDSEGRLK